MTSRGQSLADVDRDVRQYLIRIAGTLGDLLGDALTGLYVHGSLATGSFHRERSDIDLLAVVRRKLDREEREGLARTLVRLSDMRPSFGDIEISVVQERHARTFEHPLPYEVRYSRGAHEDIRHGRVDFSADVRAYDLAADVAETRERGVTLVGPPPDSMFGPVPWHAYIGALQAEFEGERNNLNTIPVTAVLGACRVLYGTTARAMHAMNKDEAAVWALQTVPRMYHSVINDALQLYRGTKGTEDVIFQERDIIAFREYVRERSQGAFARAADSDEEE